MRRTGSLGALAVGNICISVVVQWYILVQIGAGAELDAYFASLTVPFTVLAVATSSLSQVLVPILTVTKAEQFSSIAWGFFAIVGLAFIAVCAVLFVLAPYWVPPLFPGFTDATKSLTVQLTRVQLPGMLFMALSIVLSAAYHAREKFYWAQTTPVLGSLAMLAGIVWALPSYGILAVAWLSVLRSALQAALLVPGVGRCRSFSFLDPRFLLAWRRIKPLLLGSSVFKMGPLVDRYLASLAPAGALSLLVIGQQVYSAGLQVFDRAVAVPFVPAAAKYFGSSDFAGFRRRYQSRLTLAGVISCTAYLGFLLFGRDLLSLVLQYGRILEENVSNLWTIMVVMGGMLVGGVAGQLSAAGLNAMGETRAVMRIAILGFGLSILVKYVGFLNFGVYGIAAGIVFYQIFNAAFLHRALVRKLDRHHA